MTLWTIRQMNYKNKLGQKIDKLLRRRLKDNDIVFTPQDVHKLFRIFLLVLREIHDEATAVETKKERTLSYNGIGKLCFYKKGNSRRIVFTLAKETFFTRYPQMSRDYRMSNPLVDKLLRDMDDFSI